MKDKYRIAHRKIGPSITIQNAYRNSTLNNTGYSLQLYISHGNRTTCEIHVFDLLFVFNHAKRVSSSWSLLIEISQRCCNHVIV